MVMVKPNENVMGYATAVCSSSSSCCRQLWYNVSLCYDLKKIIFWLFLINCFPYLLGNIVTLCTSRCIKQQVKRVVIF